MSGKRKKPEVNASYFSKNNPDLQALYKLVNSKLVIMHGRRVQMKPTSKSNHVCGGQKTVLDALLSTILSQNTSSTNSSTAWRAFKARYGRDYERVRTAPLQELEDVLRPGGMAKTRARRIQEIVQKIHTFRNGDISLEYLREKETEEIKSELSSTFKGMGVGPKTISCVLMFNMMRSDFPVDTHVHRLSQRIGIVPTGYSRETTYQLMNQSMPDNIKYEMHVLLIRHGRTICKAQNPLV
eukprot:TRINITY_DN674_c0_g1_i2.p1 TRINITY_DN674_c0_g1~~TRINITY_DN674_c0_g1_i2.p1  ORF type:complete len:240 (-),score=31.74 TRINITY_DN674_c0_g1_i2:473-1192(-)